MDLLGRLVAIDAESAEVLAGVLLIGVAVLDLADKWESIREVFGL